MPHLKVNDLDIHYTERGDGPTVIALHAATADGPAMGWLAHAVRHEGFNVVTPDQRGHGQTPNPAGHLHLDRLVGDLMEFTYMLGRPAQHGAGYSLGGAVVLYAALLRPDLFRSLILLGTNYHAPSQERLLKLLGPEEQRPPIQQAVFNPETGAVVGWDQPLETFKSVTCPTLIICADRDQFNDPEDSLALYRTLPNAELLVVPHSDHLGLVRHAMVYAAIREFYTHVPH